MIETGVISHGIHGIDVALFYNVPQEFSLDGSLEALSEDLGDVAKITTSAF